MIYAVRLLICASFFTSYSAEVLCQSAEGKTSPVVSASKQKYTVTIVGDYNDAGYNLRAMNDRGDVTGADYLSAFIYKDGVTRVIFPRPGDGFAIGTAINHAGDIAGYTGESLNGDHPRAFIYQNGKITFPDFGGESPYSMATDINRSGKVIGTASKNGCLTGFLFDHGLTTYVPGLSLTGPPCPNSGTNVTGINDLGEIVGNTGTHAFLYTHGFTVDIGTISPTSFGTAADRVDSSGRILVYSFGYSGKNSPWSIYSAGKFNNIPGLHSGDTVRGMNDCGEVVGSSYVGPFLYSHGVITPLVGNGLPSIEPLGINNHGQIFGSTTVDGGTGIALLTPKFGETCGSDATVANTPSVSAVGPGEEITYTIVAKNIQAPTQHFTVSNELGRASKVLSCGVAGSAGSCATAADGRTIVVDLPNLIKGTAATITTTVRIAGNAGDNQLVMDTATLSSDATTDYLSTAYTNIRLTADLSVKATLVEDNGGLLHYQATVTDAGPNNSHAALFLDPIPANTSFVSVSTTAGKCSFHPTIGANGAVRCPLGNLANMVPAKVDVVLKDSPQRVQASPILSP